MSNSLKNFARGGSTYHHHRLEIARQLLNNDGVKLEPLSPFLSGKFFRIDPNNWTAFAFTPKDWEICERLRGNFRQSLEFNFLQLVLSYAEENK